ncbi:MAG: hypothetical protein U5Q16_01185 [Gammaproteobacteria bacterium]|nr:hypothetical protein [Gammaproteobacteria bacterium]
MAQQHPRGSAHMLTWMTRLMALAAIAAAGCASAPQERETESARGRRPRARDILAEPLDEDAYSTPRRCISIAVP